MRECVYTYLYFRTRRTAHISCMVSKIAHLKMLLVIPATIVPNYADDIKLSEAMKHPRGVASLKLNPNSINTLPEIMNMQFNARKYRALHYKLTNAP